MALNNHTHLLLVKAIWTDFIYKGKKWNIVYLSRIIILDLFFSNIWKYGK